MRRVFLAFFCAFSTQVAFADANPAFLKKLADPANYRVDRHLLELESICGTDDMQFVNDYDGTLGQSMGFVRTHKFSVGALSELRDGDHAKYCSGSLVGPDLFLTAAHCIDSTITSDFVTFNYEYESGSTNPFAEEHFAITEVVADGDGLDYAVLRLDGMPGLRFGWNTLRTRQPVAGELITIIQHPWGKPKLVEIGHVHSLSTSYLRYGDLDTDPGSSGSSIFDKDGHVIGVHTNGGCYQSGGTNSGVRLNAARTHTEIARLAQAELPFEAGDSFALSTEIGGDTYYLTVDNSGADPQLSVTDVASSEAVFEAEETVDANFVLETAVDRRSYFVAADALSRDVILDVSTRGGSLNHRFDFVADDNGGVRVMVIGDDEGARFLTVDGSLGLVTSTSADTVWTVDVK